MTEEPEMLLPEDVRLRAVKSGQEWGWRAGDIMNAIDAAQKVGLANIGGQVQFVLPGGTCELYWENYDSTERQAGETWSNYVERSASEVSAMLQHILKTTDLVEEGKRSFALLKEKADVGIDLSQFMVFMAYFATEA